MTTIVVKYHQEDGAWWAETDALPTFSAAGQTFGEVHNRAHTALRELISPELEIADDLADVGVPVGVVVELTEVSPSSYPATLRTTLGRSGTSITRRAGAGAVGYVRARAAT